MKAILFKDGVEFKRSEYPRADMQPLEQSPGQALKYVWKIIREGVKPSYDPRLYTLVKDEVNSENDDSEFAHLKVYEVNYVKTAKSKAQIINEIEKIEEENNALIHGSKEKDKLLLMALGSILRKIEGNTLTTFEENLHTKIMSKAANVYRNHQELVIKRNAVNNDTFVDADIDTNWDSDEG
jgi:hypothetical protein